LDALPDIEVHIGSGIVVNIAPRLYIRYEEQSGVFCGVFAMFSMPSAGELFLLGDVFIRSSYLIFDRSTNPARIGFGKPNCTAISQKSGGRRDPLIFVIVIGAAVAVGVAVFAAVVLIERRKQRMGSASSAVAAGGMTTGGSRGSNMDVINQRLTRFDNMAEEDQGMGEDEFDL
jgi:hypothetical protein